jgi:NADPH:quinone reductase-like Zn-dependent oxidoreductase
MLTINLTQFGLDNLTPVDVPVPTPSQSEVLVKLEAASLNPRDAQIIAGAFTPNVDFPLIPLSDGAGTIAAVGDAVTRFKVGDRVTPSFFPNWISGEALTNERSISSGLEAPGTAREYGVYSENALAAFPDHLTAAEAACYPCAGLTAWTALFEKSGIGEGSWVLVQGTGGVASMGIQLAKAAGANVIVISSSNEKLEQAAELGADHQINYVDEPDWGLRAFEVSGHGVDAVLEIGGAGTLENSLNAIRHGGHINIIGYMAGVEMGITVFPLIIKNANFHGIGTGNRDGYEALMAFVGEHGIKPVISERFSLEEIQAGFDVLNSGSPFGKVVLEFG